MYFSIKIKSEIIIKFILILKYMKYEESLLNFFSCKLRNLSSLIFFYKLFRKISFKFLQILNKINFNVLFRGHFEVNFVKSTG